MELRIGKGWAFLIATVICFLAGLVWLVQLHLLVAVVFFALAVVGMWKVLGGHFTK